MVDEAPRKIATRRAIIAGAGGLLAAGLGCSSAEDEGRVLSSPGADAAGGRGGSFAGAGNVEVFPARDAAGGGPDEAGGAIGRDAEPTAADAFVEAGAGAVIDCHTHFFDPTRMIPSGRSMSVPWPPPASVLYRRTLPPDYETLATPLGISGTVVIEASPWLEDNQWILDLAATSPAIVAFVGNLSEVMGKAGFDAALARFAANPLFRGIRVGPGALVAANMSNFVALGDQGLMIDVLCSPGDLQAIAAFAAKMPKVRIVVDHVGGLQIDGKAPPSTWVSGMQS